MEDHRPSPAGSGCPGAAMQQCGPSPKADQVQQADQTPPSSPSELRQWPVQLMLVPPNAPYFKSADIVIVADCVPFAFADFHQTYLRRKAIVVGCPKLDDLQFYEEKLAKIFSLNIPRSVEVLLMEVPCCGALAQAAKAALERSGAKLPLKVTTVGVRGEGFGSREW